MISINALEHMTSNGRADRHPGAAGLLRTVAVRLLVIVVAAIACASCERGPAPPAERVDTTSSERARGDAPAAPRAAPTPNARARGDHGAPDARRDRSIPGFSDTDDTPAR